MWSQNSVLQQLYGFAIPEILAHLNGQMYYTNAEIVPTRVLQTSINNIFFVMCRLVGYVERNKKSYQLGRSTCTGGGRDHKQVITYVSGS